MLLLNDHAANWKDRAVIHRALTDGVNIHGDVFVNVGVGFLDLSLSKRRASTQSIEFPQNPNWLRIHSFPGMKAVGRALSHLPTSLVGTHKSQDPYKQKDHVPDFHLSLTGL
jgi:hypothetical protein